MSRLYLKFPTLSDKEKVLDFKNEFLSSGQKMAGVAGLDRLENFEDWLSKITRDLKQETCDDGKVPSTLYLSFRGGDNKLVGIVQVRHKLNQHLGSNKNLHGKLYYIHQAHSQSSQFQ